MVFSDGMRGNGHKFPETQTEIQKFVFEYKETFFLSHYLNAYWFCIALGRYVQLTAGICHSINHKDCVNYFFISAGKLKNRQSKPELKQVQCHFRKSYKSNKDACQKPVKEADLHPAGQQKKKSPPGGCSIACTGSHSTVLFFFILYKTK